MTNDDKYSIMAFMIKREANNRAKKTLEKFKNYSRMPLTNDDNYDIMATMTNNDKQYFFERMKMNFSDLCFACVFGVLSSWLWVAMMVAL